MEERMPVAREREGNYEVRPGATGPRSRFSLLWVCMLIALGLVALALLSPMSCQPREPARRAACRNCLRNLSIACSVYAEDNNGHYPDTLERLYPDFVDNARVFSCPSAPSEWRDFNDGDVSQASSSYVLEKGITYDMPSGVVLIYDKSTENHSGYGRGIGYGGGRAEWVRDRRKGLFEKRIQRQRKAVAAWHRAKAQGRSTAGIFDYLRGPDFKYTGRAEASSAK